MAGRKRKPDHLKLVSGTAQPCRMNPDAPKAIEDLPTAPDWLSARAAEIFDGLVAIVSKMGVGSASDTAMLAMASSRLETESCASATRAIGTRAPLRLPSGTASSTRKNGPISPTPCGRPRSRTRCAVA